MEGQEGTHRLYVYLDVRSGGYRWVLRSPDGERLARSSRAYRRKALCIRDVEAIEQTYPGALIKDLTVKGGSDSSESARE